MTERAPAEMQPPSIVSSDESVARAAADALRGEGWSVAWSWQLPEHPWDLSEQRRVCAGSVDAPDALSDMVLAAVRGAVIVVHCRDEALLPSVVDELARVTRTERRDGTPAGPALADEQREILERLSNGATMAETASELFLSMRTTERRLAAARKALGVSTTAEAITAYRRIE